MDVILPDDGPQVDPWDGPAREWDYESIIPSDWRWTPEAVQAHRAATGWGPR